MEGKERNDNKQMIKGRTYRNFCWDKINLTDDEHMVLVRAFLLKSILAWGISTSILLTYLHILLNTETSRAERISCIQDVEDNI
jgi:hypothetical protein